MNVQRGIPYKIKYLGKYMEGVYLGALSRNIKNNHLILLNTAPEAKKTPLNFDPLFVKSLYVENNELFYYFYSGRKSGPRINKLEQEYLNEQGRRYWKKE